MKHEASNTEWYWKGEKMSIAQLEGSKRLTIHWFLGFFGLYAHAWAPIIGHHQYSATSMPSVVGKAFARLMIPMRRATRAVMKWVMGASWLWKWYGVCWVSIFFVTVKSWSWECLKWSVWGKVVVGEERDFERLALVDRSVVNLNWRSVADQTIVASLTGENRDSHSLAWTAWTTFFL